MRNLLLLPAFLLFSVFVKAQCAYPPCSTCVDSTQINIYYQCYYDYNPVCGCDGKTYRNICAADYWGGLINAQTQPIQGPCGSFDFDFVPNPIVPGSALNNTPYLSIYSQVAPVTALVQIFDIFGREWYANLEQIGTPQAVYTAQSPPMDGFQQGLYYVFVTINGESQHKKIAKVDLR